MTELQEASAEAFTDWCEEQGNTIEVCEPAKEHNGLFVQYQQPDGTRVRCTGSIFPSGTMYPEKWERLLPGSDEWQTFRYGQEA